MSAVQSDVRLQLLTAALAEHGTLTAALAAARDAEVWLLLGQEQPPLLPVLMLPSFEPAPQDPSPSQPERKDRRRPVRGDSPSGAWQAETMEVIRGLVRDGLPVRAGAVAAALQIESGAASWRMRQLADSGLLVREGDGIFRRYHLAEPMQTAVAEVRAPAPQAAPVAVSGLADVVAWLREARCEVIDDVSGDWRVNGVRYDRSKLVAYANKLRAAKGLAGYALDGDDE